MENKAWLSLMIGNSRLHWAVLARDQVLDAWDSSHIGRQREGSTDVATTSDPATVGAEIDGQGIPLSFLSTTAREMLQDGPLTTASDAASDGPGQAAATAGEDESSACLRLNPRRFKVASVVPRELALWLRRCPGVRPITSQEALAGVENYATLGVDRALAVRGAACVGGWPVMVVDCGSALTFTASNKHGRLGGGAILPGVRLQLAALGTRTAQLPSDVTLPEHLPPRWAMSTPGGIQAGVMWTIVAGIRSFVADRWKLEPESTIIFTGGDGQLFHKAVVDSWEAEESAPERIRDRIKYVQEVIHLGIASLCFESVEP